MLKRGKQKGLEANSLKKQILARIQAMYNSVQKILAQSNFRWLKCWVCNFLTVLVIYCILKKNKTQVNELKRALIRKEASKPVFVWQYHTAEVMVR